MSGCYEVVSSSCNVPIAILSAFLIAGLRAAFRSHCTLDIISSVMLTLLFVRFRCVLQHPFPKLPPVCPSFTVCYHVSHPWLMIPWFYNKDYNNHWLPFLHNSNSSALSYSSVLCRSSKKCSWRVDRDRVVWSLTAPLCSCLTIYLYEQVNQAVSLVSPMSSPSGWQLRWWNEGQIVTCLLYHLLRRGSYNHMCVICR